jgi:hypothetical protein
VIFAGSARPNRTPIAAQLDPLRFRPA